MGELVHLKRESKGATRIKLSKSKIDALDWDPDGGSWQVVWDSIVENLGVRLGARSKSWILRYRNSAGKRRCWTIGSTSKILVNNARELAEKGNARITLGEDPSKQKQDDRAAGKIATTFDGLARTFIDEYARSNRKSWETDESRLLPDAKTKTPIRRLHALNFESATRHDVEDVLLRVHGEISSSTPVEADRVVQIVNTALNWHVKHRNISSQFVNIMEIIDLNGWQKHEEHLRPAELVQFAEALRPLSLKWKAAIWLTLLTGSRMRHEVLQLRWQDVHLNVGEFTFATTKNGKSHTLPMTPATRAIFEALPRKGEWLFPSRVPDTPTQDSRKTFEKVRKAGKFVDVIKPHALRHTARTYLEAKLHVSGPVVDAVLNHSTQGMAGTYTHAGIDDIRDALARLETFVLSEAKIGDFAVYLTRSP